MTFEIQDTLLGKKASYPERYDASLLFRIPRSENRLRYGIEDNHLPFMGVDVLNCYEVSFLTNNGLPISRMLKLIYAAESKYLVESKSLKLYLNSFNMERLGKSIDQAEQKISELIQQDLSRLLETEVSVSLFSQRTSEMIPFDEIRNNALIDLIPEDTLQLQKFDNYTETPSLLKAKLTHHIHKYQFTTDLLRSNCRVTHQPDWGDLFVMVETNYEIVLASVLTYLVSFRKENHFHEEVVEMIYKRFQDAFCP
ncbi:MAG: NADPH-dependent 7-cyano-7-deazaguanine reductase QueF, partial [Paludibacteraceae bacterium]|nr:NADPH-dependent 7-cyano-7-deazaguanine reductase QueF [Paludibacteraceae bacterium]